MWPSHSGSDVSASMSARSLSGISEIQTIRIGVDLVSAARRNLGFLRDVADSQWLHQSSTIVEAIRRYEELWLPLISDLTVVGSSPPMILPPSDIEWVWFCHTLNPVGYRNYCEKKFSKMIGKPALFDEENEEYALMRCREIWIKRYPLDPFENEADSDLTEAVNIGNQELLTEIKKLRFIYSRFSEPYRFEIVYLMAAKQRYKGFVYMLQRFCDGCSSLVPASDILLMWLTHQSYPTVYAEDVKEMEGEMGKVMRVGQVVKGSNLEETKRLWQTTIDQPYEKAGGEVIMEWDAIVSGTPPVYWKVFDADVNNKYKSMLPRFLLEVCVYVRLNSQTNPMQKDVLCEFLRLRTVRCHSELKLDKPVSTFPFESFTKAWHLYCEFGTKGVIAELRHRGSSGCFKGSTAQEAITFHWNDLLRAPSLTLERKIDEQVRVVASITPPVQAPYLLKCVPDRVTDDSGAIISDVILRLNHYRPQEGRWLSRTVLDHTGRDCFVIRIRVGGGFWRRGGETPSVVKWEDRIIEIREGSWSYVAGSIGKAPEKVVGTATPKEPQEQQWKAAWHFSTGDKLMIQWDSSTSISSLRYRITNQASEESVKLLKGRKMQYQVRKAKSKSENESQGEEDEGEEVRDEDGFVTLVRFSEENPMGKATALINWKLMVVEVLGEEDAVFVLLVCICILRSVSEMRKDDVGNLLIRRRLKETKIGTRDWGSVVLHPSISSSPISSSPYLHPWYWNADAVMAFDGTDHIVRQPAYNRSPVEGGDKLYKRGIIT